MPSGNPLDIWNYSDKIAKVVNRPIDPTTTKWLGAGYYAQVYGLGDLAIKITGDKSDAANSEKVRGLKLKTLVYVDDVFIISDGIYGIVTKQLQQLPSHESEFISELCEADIGSPLGALYYIEDDWTDKARQKFKKQIAWLYDLKDELSAYNIDWSDFHRHNVLWDPDDQQLKIIDLGGYEENLPPDMPRL